MQVPAGSPTVVETFAAWYGAIVSTFALTISLYVALRDRPRLRISVHSNMGVRPNADERFSPNRAYAIVEIANTGRRTVTLATVWFSQKPGVDGDLALDDSARVGSREIPEGKSTKYVLEQTHFPGMYLHRVFVRDETGRIWTRRVPDKVRQAYQAAPTRTKD